MLYDVIVIGGGAAGIVAAISAARAGESVVICERMPRLGKKILATGNGRCNLLNDNLSEEYYNTAGRALVRSVFEKFGKKEILDFFKSLGLEVYSQDGRIFPATNQASSVMKVLEMELRRLSIPVELNFTCIGISFSNGRILVSSKEGETIECRKVVITGGGRTYPALGSDGSIYEIARQLGHTIVDPVPSAVPLVAKDPLCQVLQGQKIFASARSIIEGTEGSSAKGELLFTNYGFSGSCILDVSEEISIAINRQHRRDVYVAVDMVPFMDRGKLKDELVRRKKANLPSDEMLAGILPNKLCLALARILERDDLDSAVGVLKGMRFKVDGTRGWNEAEFTAGGVNVDEIQPVSLESKFKKGVFFAGEVLDVDGQRGGYNLAWAWASGWVAGLQSKISRD
ncbi:MAG: aminoacetone oxidase family FAD-binding enzyme [Dehalococcoidales bacterium]|nr:aminoacetone oxidase family FAD-binding enzyme [Dehalococcoidales bacterium]